MEVDWDLHAVVRGSSSSHSPHPPPPTESHLPTDQQSLLLDWQLPFEPARRSAFQDLHDLYKPFFRKPFPVSLSSSSSSSLFLRTKNEPSPPSSVCQSPPRPPPASQSSKSKKRKKNTLKKVCEVPADTVSSDVWAWRKYGQKPIKGSPFPRSYYRCSSSKGCLARKQVERNRSDPGMFIVTYTGEHNHPSPTHRDSLAGVSLRQKLPSPASTPTSEITNCDSNVELATCCSSPEEKEESAGEQEQEQEMVEEWEMLTGNDFFAGLEGWLMGWGGGGGGSGDKEEVEEQGRWDPRQTCLWTANNTAAGGS